MLNIRSCLFVLFFGVLYGQETREFDRIEKFFPTNSDRDAQESTLPIKITTPDGIPVRSPVRSIRPRGIVFDEPVNSQSEKKVVTENPVESTLPSTASPSESSPEATPASSSEEEEPQGEGRGTGVASARQYYFNARQASPLASDRNGSPGGHSLHHDKQMVLVFAHSGEFFDEQFHLHNAFFSTVEIPLVMTPTRAPYTEHHQPIPEANHSEPRFLFAQSRPQVRRAAYFQGHPYAQAFRAISLPGPLHASPSNVVRTAGVRLLPMTRINFIGGNLPKESTQRFILVPQPVIPQPPQIMRIAAPISQPLPAESQTNWSRFVSIARIQ